MMKNEHKILHLKFMRYGANAKEWMRKCVLLLPKIEKHRIWEQKGFGSIYEYAAKLAGMSRNTVFDTLRILQKIVEEKGLNAVRPVVTIAAPETARFWAEKAKIMSKNTLEMYVREFRKQQNSISSPESIGSFFDRQREENGRPKTECDTATICEQEFRTSTGNNAKSPHEQAIEDFTNEVVTAPDFDNLKKEPHVLKKIVAMELDLEVADRLQKLKGQGDWNELMKQLLQMRAERLEQQKPEPIKTESRHVPVKI